MTIKSNTRSSSESSTSTSESKTTLSTESSSDESCSRGSWNTANNSDGLEDDRRVNDDDFPSSARRRINPILKLRFDNRGKESQQRPRLLFRAFDTEHGLHARFFQDWPSSKPLPSPPPYGSDKFGKLAYRHLVQDRAFPSPFLSVTESPRRALEVHLANTSGHRSLAILDYNVLEEELKKLYGSDAGPWLVPEVTKRYEFTDLAKIDDDRSGTLIEGDGYTGRGEFLIWASVPCDAIAVLSYEEALQVYHVLGTLKRSKSAIDDFSGSLIGKCLRGIPPVYKAVVGRKLVHAFEISGYKKGRHSICLERFMEGVEAGSSDSASTEGEDKAGFDTESVQPQEQTAQLDNFIRELEMYATIPTPTPPRILNQEQQPTNPEPAPTNLPRQSPTVYQRSANVIDLTSEGSHSCHESKTTHPESAKTKKLQTSRVMTETRTIITSTVDRKQSDFRRNSITEDDDEVQIIAESNSRRQYARTRTETTVITIRSRSVSEE
ncbi:hypothetical protein AYO20_08184 [Fonsecaea nubica]|uniref:DUF7587 domain-containing protein n=1 Tax=Fonsecaea nubica TaxID=856822 RepID=A0A178CRW8_9EURO|nr:hypothetical protein AYO20_08184 [Fonsecaea nubica]OAL31641.1 hypothetical protein AYO20_08184 [Fonsecaea nubica]